MSDATYNVRGVMSYVSSNAYYGYIPHWKPETQQHNGVVEHNNGEHSTSDYCNNHHVTAMETEDDGYNCHASSSRLNNHCVIPEISPRRNCRLEVMNSQQRCRQQQQQAADIDIPFHKNRKRSCSDQPIKELKKFRKGGGNDRVYYGTGSTKDYGLAQMYYDPTSLCINTIDYKFVEQPSITIESCCPAAGNSSLSSSDYKHLLSSNGSKSDKSNAEYENMFFETHGCSAYHHQRMRLLDNDHIETEF